MILYICTGLPRSGKSTWTEKMVAMAGKDKPVYAVNRDAIRMMIGAGKYVLDKERTEQVVKAAADLMTRSLLTHGSVIVDETNITAEKRGRLIDLAHEVGAIPIIVYFTENERNLRYRMRDPRGRSAEVWGGVIDGMRENFEVPTANECDIIKVDSGDI